MGDVRITKRSPVSMRFFQSIGDNKNALEAYQRLRLTPSKNAKDACKDVASRVIQALDQCPKFVGRAVHTGSGVRDVSLKKPLWSDVDIVCFLQRDTNDRLITSFEHFEKARWIASKFVKEYLENEIGTYFDEASVVHDGCVTGFVVKLEVKRSSISIRPWSVDVLFARDLEINNNEPQWGLVERELDELLLATKRTQTNSMAPYRDAFLQGIYTQTPRLKGLVKSLKAFYRILTSGERKSTVNGFFFEMLAVLLFFNKFIPANFSLPRALATCYEAMAAPSKFPALCFGRERAGGDALNRPAPPSDEQLSAMKNKAGAYCLVLVDPFAPFNNVAAKKRKQMDAWPVLEEGAANILEALKSKNVAPYAF